MIITHWNLLLEALVDEALVCRHFRSATVATAEMQFVFQIFVLLIELIDFVFELEQLLVLISIAACGSFAFQQLLKFLLFAEQRFKLCLKHHASGQ